MPKIQESAENYLETIYLLSRQRSDVRSIDIAAELERIRKEIEKAQNGLRGVEQKLSNEKFVSRAPEAVVNAEREKAVKYQELIAKLEESAKAMQA